MMGPLSSFVVVLKEWYSEEEWEQYSYIVANMKEYIVIDERSDWDRAHEPMEEAMRKWREQVCDDKKTPGNIPGKIEIKKG